MNGHSALLALTVLCSVAALSAAPARAQEAVPPAEPSPSAPPAPPAEALPPPAPSTPVDTPPPPPVHTAPSAAATPSARGLDRFGAVRHRDAHLDRLLFAPTAETHPRGTFYATSYYIVVLQLGYAVTDSTQISVTATPPLGAEKIVPGDISLKTVLLRAPHVTVAGMASASGILGFEEFSGFLGRAGGAVTFCADAEVCRFAISTSSNVALAGPASVLFNGVGLSYRAARIVSLVAEVDTAIPLGEPIGEVNGLLGGAALRLSGRAWGVDLGLMKAGKARGETSGFFPFLAATYRHVP